jgi:kumamolisin
MRPSPAPRGSPQARACMSSNKVPLEGSRRYTRAGAEIRGRIDPQEWCDITVKLRPKNALPQPDIAVGAPALTREELIERHAADNGDMREVEQVLNGLGLSLALKDPASRRLKFTGTAEAMEQAFDTHLFRAVHGKHEFRTRTGELRIPASLEGKVVGVFGLDTRRMAHRGDKACAIGAVRADRPIRPWFTPAELAGIYDFPPADGVGQTVALLEFGGEYRDGDLRLFAERTGMTAIPEVETVDVESLSPANHRDPDASGEVMLDVEVIAGAAPGAKQVIYFCDFTEQGWVDGIDTAIHDSARQAGVLSIGWGLTEGELTWTDQATDAINESLKTAALLGITVLVAAGDGGSAGQADDGRVHVNFPASSPFVVAVGGTMLPRQHGKFTEVVWKEGDGLPRNGGGSTGGGVSSVFARPSWQTVIISPVNRGAMDGRIIPDVAANAAISTGYFTVAAGKSGVSGGTGAAAPLWAALVARLNGALKPSRKTVGYLTPRLYQKNAKSGDHPVGAAGCNDVTIGNNVTAPAGGYHAAIGFDAVTGWGSPRGRKLAELLS